MRLPLISKPYQERSLIASAQRSINLFAEVNTDDPAAPVPITDYPTPGTTLFGVAATDGPTRCTYRTSIGTGYQVVGSILYAALPNGALAFVGSITDRPSQCYMADNGLCAVLVDGVSGWVIDLATNQFASIIDPSFYGADFVVFLDTFFIFNRPRTNQFYISLSMPIFALFAGTVIDSGTITNAGLLYDNGTYTDVPLIGGTGTGATANITVAGNVITVVTLVNGGTGYLAGDILSVNNTDVGGFGGGFAWTVSGFALAFDPLDISAKSGNADPIAGLVTIHRELWLIGRLTSEVWIGTGAADFYFQQQQGAFIDHGCAAPYSIANQDLLVFWLMQDKQGSGMVIKGMGYDVEEISTPAIVKEFKSYEDASDAIGFCFQIEDHAFYCITFPTANKTWLYELKTKQWCEWNWSDTNGTLNRHRANCCMFIFGKNLIGDWEHGLLWELDPNVYTDVDPDTLEALPIRHIRTFPHLLNDGKKVFYNGFIADMECGTAESDNPDEFKVDLSWSDDRGKTFGNPVQQSMGIRGQYDIQPNWNRLGMARDRIFQLSYSAGVKTAINGAFIETSPSGA